MNKKLVASLVATMAVGATAFAANPFVDVPSDSWAYNSVVELANSGIIQGVDGVHFQGERNITRYEAAEIVAKAMAHEDRANVQMLNSVHSSTVWLMNFPMSSITWAFAFPTWKIA